MPYFVVDDVCIFHGRNDDPINAWQDSGSTYQALVNNSTDASIAVALLNRALKQQSARRYTASSKLIAQAESIPGFRWTV